LIVLPVLGLLASDDAASCAHTNADANRTATTIIPNFAFIISS
jgi:hypothetical protein